MDPLSVIAGVTGVIGFAAQTATSLKTLISDIRDAPEAVRDLLSELDGLSSILESTQELIGSHRLQKRDVALVQRVYLCAEDCQRAMWKLRQNLEPLKQDPKSSGLLKQTWTRTAWTWRKRDIEAYKITLNGYRANLHFHVSVLNW